MSVASISAIKNVLIKNGLKEKEDKNGYFECPKSVTGKKITISSNLSLKIMLTACKSAAPVLRDTLSSTMVSMVLGALQ